MKKKIYIIAFIIQTLFLVSILFITTTIVYKRVELLESFDNEEVYSYFWGKEFYTNIKKINRIIPPKESVFLDTKNSIVYFVAYALMPRRSFTNYNTKYTLDKWCSQGNNIWIIRFEDSSLIDMKIYRCK